MQISSCIGMCIITQKGCLIIEGYLIWQCCHGQVTRAEVKIAILMKLYLFLSEIHYFLHPLIITLHSGKLLIPVFALQRTGSIYFLAFGERKYCLLWEEASEQTSPLRRMN